MNLRKQHIGIQHRARRGSSYSFNIATNNVTSWSASGAVTDSSHYSERHSSSLHHTSIKTVLAQEAICLLRFDLFILLCLILCPQRVNQ